MKVSVVIPTHNRSGPLAKTLLYLSRQQFTEPWEAIVVNNRCVDDTDEVVRAQRFPAPLRLIHEEKPGASAARNAGIAVASGRYIVLVDDDILTEPDYIRRHYELLLSNPGCWITGQVVNLPEQLATPFGKYRQSLQPFVPRESAAVDDHRFTANNASLPRADWERLGGFDEIYTGAGVEDYEFAVRAWDAGIKILFCPSIVSIHNDWAGFSIKDFCLRQRMGNRFMPLLWQKYGDRLVKLRLVRRNLPPDWRLDGPALFANKLVKSALAAKHWQTALSGACAFLERNWPWPPILHRLYKVMVAVAIYQGYQEGLARYGSGSGGVSIINSKSRRPGLGH
ncbi:MAG TPA: glycosyltransferase [Blastocatellia bacterium]|nr:glycosyltransferase [Blastocatellia bacterium]